MMTYDQTCMVDVAYLECSLLPQCVGLTGGYCVPTGYLAYDDRTSGLLCRSDTSDHYYPDVDALAASPTVNNDQ